MGLENGGCQDSNFEHFFIRVSRGPLTKMLLFINKCNSFYPNSNKKMLKGTILAPGIF